MSETRRASRGGARSEDEPLGSRRQPKMKYVYRLLRQGDIGEALTGKTVYVLWPDDGTWYRGRVEECDVATGKAVIFYAETEETEEADLKELIGDGQIAFKEPRPASHVCKPGEVEQDARYRGRQPGDPELEDSSGSEGEEVPDAGALEDSSDSDVSFASDELSGRKRKRHEGEREEESDPEVQLEEFEKREIMRDMSDDEKPLGFRAGELERKHKRQAKRQATAAEVGAAPAARKPAAGAGAPQRPTPRAAPAEPARRRRREAAAGVAAAVQALAAVQAAAAADASSDDEPPSARKQRTPRRLSSGASAGLEEDDEEAEAEAFTRQLLAKAAGKAAPLPGEKGKSAFYGAGRGLDRRQSSMGQSDEDVRAKVRVGLQQALELVAADEAAAKAAGGSSGEAEAQAGGSADEDSKPSPAAVAEAVEAALFALHGGVTRDYKQKFQSLRFNLKDPHNPDLRAHVLRGEIQPDAFVRMTATELASKELAEYRKRKEEEALKMSVLDAEAAARFSTAAALDARDKLAIPASVVADKGMLAAREATPEPAGGAAPAAARAGEQHGAPTMLGEHGSAQLGSGSLEGQDAGGSAPGYRVSDSADAELAAGAAGSAEDEEYDPETAFMDDEAPPGDTAPASQQASKPAAAALDWASIKAAAASAAAEQQQQSQLGGGGGGAVEPLGSLKLQEQLSGELKGREGQHSRHGSKQRHHHHRRDRTSASPRELPSLHEGGTPASPAEPGSPHSLRHLLLPPVDSTCLFGKGVWEGQFVVPGSGAFQLSADGLAGSGDVAALLGDREIEVKGRLALQKLDHFLLELRHSRSRTVTLGLLSPADDCSPEERAAFEELVGQYTSRGRTGVAAPTRDIEAYLLPPCPTADRLLAAARGAAPAQVEAALPAGGAAAPGPQQLLLAIIHRKDWFPPYGFVRPLKRPRKHPPAGAAPAAAPAAGGESGPESSAPVLPPPPALPLTAAAGPAAGEQDAGAAQQQPVTLPAGLDLSALSALAASLGVVAPPAAPAQPAAPPAGGPPSAQPDPLQQLLSTLPASALATAPQAAQHGPAAEQAAAGGRPRRSRWEGGEGADAPQASPRPGDALPADQKQRRSRWEGSEGASGGDQVPPSPSGPGGPGLPPPSPHTGSLPQSQAPPQAQAAQQLQMGAMAALGMQAPPSGPPPPAGMGAPPRGPPQPPAGMQPGSYPGGPPHSMPPPSMPPPQPQQQQQQQYGMGPPQPPQQQYGMGPPLPPQQQPQPHYGQPQAGRGGFPPGPGGPMGPGPGMGGFPGGPRPPPQHYQQQHFPGGPAGGFPPPPPYMQQQQAGMPPPQQPGMPPPQQPGYPGGPPGGPMGYGDGGRGRGPGGRGGWYGGQQGRGGGRYGGGAPGRGRGRGRY